MASQCKQHAARFADCGDFGQRLDDADFVVGEHHGDEARVVANGVGDFLRIEPTGAMAVVLFDVEQRHFVAAACQSRERIEHGLVLGRDADQMIAAAALALGHAADGEVVAFGGAAGEDDFRRIGADGGCDRLSRCVDGVARFVAGGVDAMRVAVLRVEIGQHRLDDARIDARRGVVVHVDELLRVGGH